jgi:hypothetical protein
MFSVGGTTSAASLAEQVKKFQARTFRQNETQEKSKGGSFDSLASRCIAVITDNFAERPNLEGIPSKFLPQVTARLPLDLDINVSGPHIHDENYWKRACLTRPVRFYFMASSAKSDPLCIILELVQLSNCRAWSHMEAGSVFRLQVVAADD